MIKRRNRVVHTVRGVKNKLPRPSFDRSLWQQPERSQTLVLDIKDSIERFLTLP